MTIGGTDLKVAIVLSAIDRVTAVVSKVTSGTIKSLDTLAAKSSKIADRAFRTAKEAGFLGLALAAPLGIFVSKAAEAEQINTSLKSSFHGNAAAAKIAYDQIFQFAAKTPFALQETARSFLKLKNQGLDPSMKALEAYGNIASSLPGKSLNDFVEAVADAATNEFVRLKEFGILARAQGNHVTFLFNGVKTTVQKNSTEIQKYLQNIGKVNFAGTTMAQGKTIAGQWSTLKDNAGALAARIGTLLVPAIRDFFKWVTPVLDKVERWVKANPQLTKTILMAVAGLAALNLATSGVAFLIGGAARAVSTLATGFSSLLKVVRWLGPAFSFLGSVIRVVTMIMMTNPILLIITLIAVAALLIYKYWGPIKEFFIWLWGKIKEIFWKVVDWIKEWGLAIIAPVTLIYKYWDQIVAFFTDIWEKTKARFNLFVDYVKSIPSKMYEAGKNIVKSIWEGIKSMASKPIEAIKNIVKKIRDFLPFSPAKEGALRDIHKIRLIETIAENVKPGPLVRAMRTTTAAAFASVATAGPISANALPMRGGSGMSINYSPTININGGSPQAAIDIRNELQKHSKDILKMVQEEIRKQNRTNFK